MTSSTCPFNMTSSTCPFSVTSSARPFSVLSSARPFSITSSARPFSVLSSTLQHDQSSLQRAQPARPFSIASSAGLFNMPSSAQPFSMPCSALFSRSTRAPLPHVTIQGKVVVLIRSVSWCVTRPARTSDVSCTCSSSMCHVRMRYTEKE